LLCDPRAISRIFSVHQCFLLFFILLGDVRPAQRANAGVERSLGRWRFDPMSIPTALPFVDLDQQVSKALLTLSRLVSMRRPLALATRDSGRLCDSPAMIVRQTDPCHSPFGMSCTNTTRDGQPTVPHFNPPAIRHSLTCLPSIVSVSPSAGVRSYKLCEASHRAPTFPARRFRQERDG
jgi:hypothetical protein